MGNISVGGGGGGGGSHGDVMMMWNCEQPLRSLTVENSQMNTLYQLALQINVSCMSNDCASWYVYCISI